MATVPNYSQPAIFSEVATPTVPDSGYLKVYANSGVLASIANGGSEKRYVAISGSGLPIGAYTLPTTDGTSSQVLQTNGSGTVTWQTVSGGGGITSINGDTTAAQLLTVGTAGTNFAIDSTTTPGTSVFNIPDAGASARGLITTGTQTIAGQKTFAQGTLVASAPLTITQTWNNAGVLFEGLVFNVTNTASNSASYIMRLRSDGSDAFSFSRTGTFVGSIGRVGSNFATNTFSNTAFIAGANGSLQWKDNATAELGTADLFLYRDAANTLAQRNSTNAQTFRVYNTYTSSTSFETLQIQNVASTGVRIGYAIGSAGGTGGAARQLDIGRWNAASAWTSLLTWDANDFATFSSQLQVSGAGNMARIQNTQVGTQDDGAGFVLASNGYMSSPSATTFLVRTGQSANSGRTASLFATIHTTLPSTSYYDWRFAAPSSTSTTSLMKLAFDGTFTLTQPVSTTGSPTGFIFTGGAHTTLTASTEATDVNFNLARTVQFATGAITTQRAMRIQAPTYSFVGASTITTASTLSISGPPVAGTNATITNAYALNVESGTARFGGNILGASGLTLTGTIAASLDGAAGFSLSGYTLPCLLSTTAETRVMGLVRRNNTANTVAPVLSLVLGGLNTPVEGFGPSIEFMVDGPTNIALPIASIGGIRASTESTGHIVLCPSTTERARLTHSGDFGIGHTVPISRLDIAGDATLRNSTTATSLAIYTTYTSSTSYERVNVRGKASANFEFGPENGSAGGTLRGLTIGGYSAGTTTIAPWLTFTSSGTPTFNLGTLVIPSGGTGLMCQQTNIYLDSYGTHSGIRYRRSEGTEGSPTGVAFNSLLGFVATYGYHTGSAYHSTQGASISFYATEAFTSGAQGSKIVFGTTPNGTTTNTVALTIDQNQVATFSKLVAQSAAEITSTPSGTTQTITLNNGNHQTLTLTSATGAVTATLTVPNNVSSGTIIVKQHASTVRDITWAVSAGTIKWMGTEPDWAADAISDIRIVSWRYDGSVMYLMSTDKAA